MSNVIFKADGVTVSWSDARDSHRIQWRDTDGTRRSAWRAVADDAIAEAKDIIGRLALRRTERSSGKTVGDLIAYTLDPSKNRRGKKWVSSTLRGHRSCLMKWVHPRIGTLPCDSVNEDVLRACVDAARDAGLAERTVRNVGFSIMVMIASGRSGGFFSKSWKPDVEGIYEKAHDADDPSLFIDEDYRPQAQDVEDLAHHLEYLFPDEPWWGLMCRLCGYSGLRMGEALALTPSDIRWEEQTIRVLRQVRFDGVHADDHTKFGSLSLRKPKGGKKRNTILPPHLVDALRQRCEEVGPDGLLFPKKQGGYIRPDNLHARRLHPAMERAGGKWELGTDTDGGRMWTWHSLRHHFATWALNLGIPVAEVSMFMGHSSPKVTQDIYQGPQHGAAHRASGKIAEWFNQQEKGEAA